MLGHVRLFAPHAFTVTGGGPQHRVGLTPTELLLRADRMADLGKLEHDESDVKKINGTQWETSGYHVRISLITVCMVPSENTSGLAFLHIC
jgi:hypothetical protein